MGKGGKRMPYGFIKHIKDEGYSSETIESYEKVVHQFFKYLIRAYPENKEPYQISSSDIKNYLKEQKDRKKGISTINKELAILKTFFNYLWEIGKVPVDPAVKIKRLKVKREQNLDITYDEVLSILEKVLANKRYSKLRKAVFILAVKGFKTADFRFTKDNVKAYAEDHKVIINLKNHSIILEGVEAINFLEYYYEVLTNGSVYVFMTKPHGNKNGGPIQVMSILNHLRAISREYLKEGSKPLSLIAIRRAFAFDLYSKKYSIQMIAKELGIEENSASNYLKSIISST